MDNLTSWRLLTRNTVWNLIGYGAPLVVAVFAIPLLIRGLGTSRFGVLTLAWVLIGYLSIFDLGLRRALTKLVAEKLGSGQEQEIPALVWTALFVMFLLGVGVTIVVTLLLPWMVQDVLNIPQVLKAETLKAFYLLAFFMSVFIPSIGLLGILDAYQRFDLINVVRIPLGIYGFLAPLFVLPFSQNLFPVVCVLLAGRLIACMVHLLLCFHVVPSLLRGIVLQREMLGPLIRFGSWITVSNIISPLMLYLDRFLIGALISVAAVAYYATPNEVLTKLWLFPWALMGVFFPAFSTSFVQDRSHTALLFDNGLKYIFLVVFPIILFIITLANEGLGLWLGSEFAQNSTQVLQWIAVGVFIYSLGQVPYALIQGVGRPDLTAKLHLLELPFYLLGVYWLISAYGIEGAAIAWVARIGIDMICLFGMVNWFLPTSRSILRRRILTMGVTLLTLALAALPLSFGMKGLFLLMTLTAFALASWFLILTPEERMLIGNRFKGIQMSN